MTLDIERERRDFEALKSVRGYVRHESWSHTEGYMIRSSSDYVDPITQAQWEGWLAAKRAVVGSAEPVLYRCFHCKEEFTDEQSAILHFGRSERENPACTIDIAEYRAMEQRMVAYNSEDAEIHHQLYRMQSQHQTALKREEEIGYERGLRDAVKYPDEVKCLASDTPSTDAKDSERMFPMQHPCLPIPWKTAEIIYAGYAALYGTNQSMERMAERGGFGWGEVGIIYREPRAGNLMEKLSRAAIAAKEAAK